MVKSCCAYGCEQRAEPGVSFFTFPKDEKRRKQWVVATRRKGFEPSKYSVLCQKHFLPTDFHQIPGEGYKPALKPDAVPSVFPAFPSYYQIPTKKDRRSLPRHSRPEEPMPSTSTDPLPSALETGRDMLEDVSDVEDVVVEELGIESLTTNDQNVQTDLTMKNISALNKKCAILKRKQLFYARKIKTLKQNVKRKTKKIKNLKELTKSLKKKGLAGDDLENLILSEFSGISKEIFSNVHRNAKVVRGGQRYSQELKKFALTLYYNSPQAYRFCRPVLKLPSPSAISKWISNVDVKPGFLTNVFERLKQLPEESKDCNLVIDGMSIRKQIIWSQSDQKFLGYCDFGDAQIEGHDVPATEALVFMLVGLKEKWKWPIAYFLQNKTSAHVQASLIKLTVHLSKQAGLKVHGVTFDGTSTNIATLNSLGCNFYGQFDELKTEFTFSEQKMFAIPDPCHMLKLARNCLATLGKIKSPTGIIDWSYILKLHELQTSVGLKFANKLSRAHVEWNMNKMKVKLAAQTLSNSIATALEYLDQEAIAGFQGTEETVKFIKQVDKLFDFLNSRNPFVNEERPKAAITLSNYEKVGGEMMGIVKYLYSLTTIDNTPLYESNRKTFVIGFGAAVKSILAISKSLLDAGHFKYILTYKFSQDHIETFFSRIRQRHGFNNNPNVQQFRWAIRQILLKNEISASALGNSLFSDSDPVGSIFDIRWKKRNENLDDVEEEEDEEQIMDEYYQCFFHEYQSTEVNVLLKDNILYYICGFVVRKIIKNIHCLDCKSSLILEKENRSSEEHTQLVHLRDLGGLVHVSNDVFKTVQTAEQVLFQALQREKLAHVDYCLQRNNLAQFWQLLSHCHGPN
ncbi:hypothetical protein M8J76_010347 [Diaphorina citri]|nr:hypothetical protein M8J76_010347 [Diaphorina citri]